MADAEVLGQLAPVLGSAPSDSTVRRVLNLAGNAALTRIAQARVRIRKHVWEQVEQTPAGFPWLAVAGKALAGWTEAQKQAPARTVTKPVEPDSLRLARVLRHTPQRGGLW